MKQLLVIVLILSFDVVPSQEALLGDKERDAIEDVLHTLGLSEEDLGFEKKWATDTIFRLEVVESLLDSPLKAPDYADRAAQLVDSFHNSLAAELSLMAEAIDVEIGTEDTLKLLDEIEEKTAPFRRECPPEVAKAISFKERDCFTVVRLLQLPFHSVCRITSKKLFT